MKKVYILSTFLLLFATITQAQNLSKFFEKYADDERFSYTKIGKNMQTLSLEINANTKSLAQSIEKEILDIMEKENFELDVAAREKKERSYIYSRQKTSSSPKESVIINRDNSEINIMWMNDKSKTKSALKDEFKDLGQLKDLENLKDLGQLKDLENLKDLGSLQSLESLKSLEKLKDLESLKDLGNLNDLKIQSFDLNMSKIGDKNNSDKK